MYVCMYVCIPLTNRHMYRHMYVYVCIYMYSSLCAYILKGLRPMPPTRTLNASRPPDRLQVTSGGPRDQQRDESIVSAHSVRTIGVLGEVLEGSQGVPWGSAGALWILWGVGSLACPWRVHGTSLEGPRGCPWESLGGPGGSLDVSGGSLGGPLGLWVCSRGCRWGLLGQHRKRLIFQSSHGGRGVFHPT